MTGGKNGYPVHFYSIHIVYIIGALYVMFLDYILYIQNVK